METAIKLKVKHDMFPENEVFINCTCECDFCGRKLPEFKMIHVAGDASVCEDCYDHFN